MAKAPPCKHFEVCNLPGDRQRATGMFCVLHDPEPGKNVNAFQESLGRYLGSRRCDLRYVHFPPPIERVDLENAQFADLTDFREAVFSHTLNLAGATFNKGVVFGGSRVGNVRLDGATVRGPLTLHADKFENTLDLHRTLIEGPVDMRVESPMHLRAREAQFHDSVSIHAVQGHIPDLHSAVFRKGLTLRIRCNNLGINRTKFQGCLDLRECDFYAGLSFVGAVFDGESTLDLSGTTIVQDLVIAGRGILPRLILLDNCTVDGKTHIEAAFGTRQPCVVAKNQPPTLEDGARFTNVDLSECLLVGNVIQRMEFSDVNWHRSGGRWMLYDEASYRAGQEVPTRRIRESYQVLKQKYAQMGDHVRSGDFHYGEMEMKRKEYGGIRQVLCLEFLYWSLSGYGTRWRRALGLLIALIAGFAFAYCRVETAFFAGNFMDTLRFSLEVTTLQRPLTPETFGIWGKWLKAMQTVLGPLQIALFALALRMRLRR